MTTVTPNILERQVRDALRSVDPSTYDTILQQSPAASPTDWFTALFATLDHRLDHIAEYISLVIQVCDHSEAAVNVQLLGLGLIDQYVQSWATQPPLVSPGESPIPVQLLQLIQTLLAQDRDVMVQVLQSLAQLFPALFRAACQFPNETYATAWSLLVNIAQENTYMLEIPDNSLFLGSLRFYYAIIETLSVPDLRIPEKVNLTGSASSSSTHNRPINQRRHSAPNLSLCPVNHPFLNKTALAKLGNHYFEQTLLVLQNPHISASAITALVNLATTYIRTHPEQIPFAFQHFIAWRDEPVHRFTSWQWRCIDKTLRIQWFNLYKILHQATQKLSGTYQPVPDQESPFALQLVANQLIRRHLRRDVETYLSRFHRYLQQKRQYQQLTKSSTLAQPSNRSQASSPSQTLSERMRLTLAGLHPNDPRLTMLMENLPRDDSPRVGETGVNGTQAEPEPTLKRHRELDITSVESVTLEPSHLTKVPNGDGLTDPAYKRIKVEFGVGETGEGMEPQSLETGHMDSMLQATFLRLLQVSDDIIHRYRLQGYPGPDQFDEGSTPLSSEEATAGSSITVNRILSDWMVLISRLVTHALEQTVQRSQTSNFKNEPGTAPGTTVDHPLADQAAKLAIIKAMVEKLFQFVTEKFHARYELGVLWLYELWYSNHIQFPKGEVIPTLIEYSTWLQRIVECSMERADLGDHTLVRFVLDVPHLSPACLEYFEISYSDPKRQKLCLAILKELVELRPPVRWTSLEILFKFCHAADKAVRQSTITVVRKWYRESSLLTGRILSAALQLFQSLAKLPAPEAMWAQTSDPSQPDQPTHTSTKLGGDINVQEVSQQSTSATAPDAADANGQDVSVPGTDEPDQRERALINARLYVEGQVIQRSEFFMALCSKHHPLIQHVFEQYPQWSPYAQQVFREHITGLIRSIGMGSTYLLDAIDRFPPGAEVLVERIVELLTEKETASSVLTQTVRRLYQERQLNPRFLAFILPTLESKADVVYVMTEILKLLDHTSGTREYVKNILAQALGRKGTENTAGSPLEHIRAQISPSDLMLTICNMEDSIGLKRTAEATTICFSMAEVYTSETLAVVLQQLTEQPKLPQLLLRHMIQSVTLHKSLTGFINGLLTRLIAKKVWTLPVVWEGFVRCCDKIKPASFTTLFQLPPPQFNEVLTKCPSLIPDLQQYVANLPPAQLNRIQHLLSILEAQAPSVTTTIGPE
ncbi:hypothetical protein IWQ61_002335 [Dispira simplex]|nr:hypothetical protein IWQ61_002335 [Dispira simplex]